MPQVRPADAAMAARNYSSGGIMYVQPVTEALSVHGVYVY